MIAATGANGLVTVYSRDAGASALLAGACDAFVRDLAGWLGRSPVSRPVALVFHRLGDEGTESESRMLDTALPAAVYHVRRPVPRWIVLRDLVILDAMARQVEGAERARVANVPDWLSLGLVAMIDGPNAPSSDRFLARAIRRTGRVPPLDRVLIARADLQGAPLVQALGALLVQSIVESPAGRDGLVRLLAQPPPADQSSVEWLSGAFPTPAPAPAYLRKWWALACVRASQRFLGARSDSAEITAELNEALNPVVRTLPDAAGEALRIPIRDLPGYRDEPWFRRAIVEAGARLDRVLLLAPQDLRAPVNRYREAVRLLASGRLSRFEGAYEAAEAAWEEALRRRAAIADYLDGYDARVSGAESADLDALLGAMRAAAAEVEEIPPSAISRYLDAVEIELEPGRPGPP